MLFFFKKLWAALDNSWAGLIIGAICLFNGVVSLFLLSEFSFFGFLGGASFMDGLFLVTDFFSELRKSSGKPDDYINVI